MADQRPSYTEAGPVAVSYSGGASSEWMVEALIQNAIPRPERFAVFFADPGAEHSWTYQAVDDTEERCRRAGIDFIRCRSHRQESLLDHIHNAIRERRTRMDHPPVWVEKQSGAKGQLQQRCTAVWKSRALRRAQSAWLKSIGAKKRIITWIGFGLDEQHRATKAVARKAKTNEALWEVLDFPAIRHRRTREQQRADLVAATGRAPQFSMCTFCPFKTRERWLATEGADLAQAEQVDEAIRDMSFMGVEEGPCFLSDELVPVERLKRLPPPPPNRQLQMFNPQCMTGACFL